MLDQDNHMVLGASMFEGNDPVCHDHSSKRQTGGGNVQG